MLQYNCNKNIHILKIFLYFGGAVMSGISTIILAAGTGAEMHSKKPKACHKICGKQMVDWVYSQAEKTGSDKIITVIGSPDQQCSPGRIYAHQPQQLGTGHAVKIALDFLPEDCGVVLVLCGDTPLITAKTLCDAIEYHVNSRNAATVISAETSHPKGYGRIIRDENGKISGITEENDASPQQKLITEINSGLYMFDAALLREVILSLDNDNAAKEYYLSDTMAILLENGYSVDTYKLSSCEEIMGINNLAQLSYAEKIMQKRINKKHMLMGVTIVDPQNTYISEGCKIGADTIILPGTIIDGETVIGEDCVIGPNANITGCKIGNGTVINASTATNSTIGSGVNMGPYAYVRPGCNIADNVKVGDFVEVKNSNIDEGTKIAHLTYVGDSDVGKNVNFGCGTVTVNYDSVKKHRTTIGDGAFIGCNSNLVAPVTVGAGAYTAAGSTITEDVPDNALAIARNRQLVKEDWRAKKFSK